MTCVRRGDYEISTDRARLDRDLVHGFLSREAYWARGVPQIATPYEGSED